LIYVEIVKHRYGNRSREERAFWGDWLRANVGFLVMLVGGLVVLSKVFFDVLSVWPLYTGTILAIIGLVLINLTGKDED